MRETRLDRTTASTYFFAHFSNWLGDKGFISPGRDDSYCAAFPQTCRTHRGPRRTYHRTRPTSLCRRVAAALTRRSRAVAWCAHSITSFPPQRHKKLFARYSTGRRERQRARVNFVSAGVIFPAISTWTDIISTRKARTFSPSAAPYRILSLQQLPLGRLVEITVLFKSARTQ